MGKIGIEVYNVVVLFEEAARCLLRYGCWGGGGCLFDLGVNNRLQVRS